MAKKADKSFEAYRFLWLRAFCGSSTKNHKIIKLGAHPEKHRYIRDCKFPFSKNLDSAQKRSDPITPDVRTLTILDKSTAHRNHVYLPGFQQ